MALTEYIMAVILAATVGVRPGQPAQPGETPPDVDARLIADLELIRMLDMLRDLEAIRQMDEIMGPVRTEQQGRPGKTP